MKRDAAELIRLESTYGAHNYRPLDIVIARPYCERLMERGVLRKETHDTVVRLAPPLIVTQEELDWALERLGDVLAGPP